MDNKLVKGLLLGLVALYVVSPVDLAPGPIDDALLILLTMASNKRVQLNNKKEIQE